MFSQSSNVYNSSSAKNLQQQTELGSSLPELKDIVQCFTNRQIDVGKSYCIIFFIAFILILFII